MAMDTTWKIREIEIHNRVMVAPMAGVSNMAFRKVCKEFGAGMVVCEMISDHGIIYGNKKTLSMLDAGGPVHRPAHRCRHHRHQHGLPGAEGNED